MTSNYLFKLVLRIWSNRKTGALYRPYSYEACYFETFSLDPLITPKEHRKPEGNNIDSSSCDDMDLIIDILAENDLKEQLTEEPKVFEVIGLARSTAFQTFEGDWDLDIDLDCVKIHEVDERDIGVLDDAT